MIFDKNEKRKKELHSLLSKGKGNPEHIRNKIKSLQKAGPEWWIRYWKKGKSHDEKCPAEYQLSKTDAQKYYKIVAGDIVQDQHMIPVTRRTTIADIADFFLSEKERKIKRTGKPGNYSAVKTYCKIMKKLVGNISLDACRENPSILQDHIDDLHLLRPNWSDKTIWNYFKELKAAFNLFIRKKLLQIPNPMDAVDEPEQNIRVIDYVPSNDDYEKIITTGIIEGIRPDVLRLIGAVRYSGLRIKEILNVKIKDCVLDPDDGGLPFIWITVLKQKREIRVPRPIRKELHEILREQTASQLLSDPNEERLWPWDNPPYKLLHVYELVRTKTRDGKMRMVRKLKGNLYNLAGVAVPRPFHDYRKTVKLELKRNPKLSKEQSKSYQAHKTDAMDDYYTFFQREDLEAAVSDSYRDQNRDQNEKGESKDPPLST